MKVLLLLILLPLKVLSQDLSGSWAGYIEAAGNDVPYELYISSENGQMEGYVMSTISINGVDNIGIKSVKFRIKKDQLQIEDDELIFNNFSTPPKKMKLAAALKFTTEGPVTDLSGSYRTRSLDFRDKSYYAGKIFLKRKPDFTSSLLVSKLKEMKILPGETDLAGRTVQDIAANENNQNDPVLAKANRNPQDGNAAILSKKSSRESIGKKDIQLNKNVHRNRIPVGSRINNPPAAFLNARETVVIQNIYFTGDSITISIYDNGVIDGDTVSVVLNGELILAKKGLATKPLIKTIYLPPSAGDSLLLVMYAENLGVFPPNTGLIVLQDGRSRTEIRFTGDLEKSAAIVLKRKPK